MGWELRGRGGQRNVHGLSASSCLGAGHTLCSLVVDLYQELLAVAVDESSFSTGAPYSAPIRIVYGFSLPSQTCPPHHSPMHSPQSFYAAKI